MKVFKCGLCGNDYERKDFTYVPEFDWNGIKASGYICKDCYGKLEFNLTKKGREVLNE
jgi:hypothetical protein